MLTESIGSSEFALEGTLCLKVLKEPVNCHSQALRGGDVREKPWGEG